MQALLDFIAAATGVGLAAALFDVVLGLAATAAAGVIVWLVRDAAPPDAADEDDDDYPDAVTVDAEPAS
jgi:hypothetical protein